ncbi:uncharacterized protein Z518_07500 [Rhinocladiella mackenziei CBS 650.93]|uniref:Rhinocladiella mackenziei CBS 650.93 unplaced genomic scaffold supercont1.5, whole genome shotgun sequence n=1 Tax=Rhinocladiella mackenziei CBS 650.93 TaxID=1442369 RepID=A0A0D2FP96_9EURO|nr:uncharacterized protein Z518_07500 [Rhinocladiella mackenziei CBS 650.93]KIX03947.1 hypothetical protein Z518_07500 [Rhinocladiella mackenziei CBS 650.93]
MSTSIMHAPPVGQIASPSSKSNLTEQIEQSEGERTPRSSQIPNKGSPKPRSLSDAPKPVLSPSPAFREPLRRISKDDSAITGPSTPVRPPIHIRGLSLHMPSKDGPENGTGASIPRIPLSPKLDSSQIYGSPSSMLPRRSRGLDYTRACTNLHHSTLAEASPDASPVTGRGIQIPARRSVGNSVLDSPSNQPSGLWSLSNDRTNLSSSVSSVNMLGSDSDSGSDSSSDDMAVDREMDDAILSTPAASRLNTGFLPGFTNSPGLEWMNNQPTPAQASLMSFQPNLMSFRRARTRKGKSQQSSSSVSMNSSKPSPGPLSPGTLKSVESAGGSYFGTGLTKRQVQSRRESLSLGTNDLHLSDSEDNNPNKSAAGQSLSDLDRPGSDGPRGVIRKAVTRRGNLLPKTKGFARIRAQLQEEAAPIESEARREAEVIRQVHENDPTVSHATSPVLQYNNPFASEPVEESIEDMAVDTRPPLPPDSFSRQAERNSAGKGFWNAFDDQYRTPPPPLLPRESSSTISDEALETPGSSLTDNPALRHFNRSRSRSITPLASNAPTAGDVARRVNNKRRREEDFDPTYTKRRAVSPGMSVQSSPILPQSPVFTNDKAWSKMPPKANGDRSNSGGGVNGTKRVGLQGMTETNEGFMSMSID